MQADVHAAFGGIVPNLAMEAHKAAMDSCVSDALEQAGIQAQDLHAIAVSIGPGLSPCLQVSLHVEFGTSPVMVMLYHQGRHTLNTFTRTPAFITVSPARTLAVGAVIAASVLCSSPHSSDLQVQVGVRKAHQLAQQYDLKLVPVHHMEAHALVARAAADVQFPFLCMLVSGGHNMLLVAHQVGNYTLLGSTLDDSVGLSSMAPVAPLTC